MKLRHPMLALMGLLALALLLPGAAMARVADGLAPDPDGEATVTVQGDDSQGQDEGSVAQDAEERAGLAKYRRKRQAAEQDKLLGFGFEVEAGYTYLQMDDLNKALTYFGADPMHGALLVGADMGVTLFNDMLEIGPRIEYIYASVDYDALGGGPEYEASLVPVTLGVRYKTSGAVSGLASLDVGQGWAKFHADSSYFGTDYYKTGTCPVADLRVGLRAGHRFHGQLEAGYRRALVDNMSGNMVNLDFSGWLGDLKLGWDF
jgi:hypothetical protein